MSTPGGSDRPSDPTAPSPSTPADSPMFDSPSFAPYEPTPSYEPTPAPTYEPVPPTPADGPGWYLAPPPPSALPPVPGDPYPPTSPPPLGYPSGPTGPTGPGRTPQGAVVAVVLAVVVILVLAVVGVGLALRAGGDRQVADPTLPSFPTSTPSSPTGTATTGTATTGSAPPRSSTPAGSSASPAPTSASEVTVPAVTPGFEGALSPKENVAYDVPPGWEIRTPGTLVGFEDNDGNPVAVVHGVSTYRRDACPDVDGSNRGNAGFKSAGTLEPADAAQTGVQIFAAAAALNEDGSTSPVTMGPVVDVQVAGGTITAKLATATLTPPADASCGAPQVVFTGVAFRMPGGGTALFIMYLDQGTPDALPAAQAQQIVASLRPYSG